MLSIWEQQEFVTYDVIIVGAGISGLSLAASLIEARPKLKILILERGILPTGASTKNAGFACFGSFSELLIDQKIMGIDESLRLVKMRKEGLEITLNRLGQKNISYELHGGYELLFENDFNALAQIDVINQHLKSLFNENVFYDASHKIKNFEFKKVNHLIYNPFEAQLHTGKLMSQLWQYCMERNVKILTGVEVEEITSHTVKTKHLTFKSQVVALCTNAFSKTLTNVELKPGRGIVLLVKPQKPLPFKGIFHFEDGFYYFRNFEDKLIFGGGRNVDMETETTTEMGINQKIVDTLIQKLNQIILPNNPYQIEMQWSGIMAFGKNKLPVIEKNSQGIYVGVRLGGMGVSIGGKLGDVLKNLILKEHF